MNRTCRASTGCSVSQEPEVGVQHEANALTGFFRPTTAGRGTPRNFIVSRMHLKARCSLWFSNENGMLLLPVIKPESVLRPRGTRERLCFRGASLLSRSVSAFHRTYFETALIRLWNDQKQSHTKLQHRRNRLPRRSFRAGSLRGLTQQRQCVQVT